MVLLPPARPFAFLHVVLQSYFLAGGASTGMPVMLHPVLLGHTAQVADPPGCRALAAPPDSQPEQQEHPANMSVVSKGDASMTSKYECGKQG